MNATGAPTQHELGDYRLEIINEDPLSVVSFLAPPEVARKHQPNTFSRPVEFGNTVTLPNLKK